MPHPILRHMIAGHFYLTKLLLPVLTATAKKAPAKSVRVVNVSSLGHYYGAPEGIRWTTLNPGTESLEERKKLGSARLFGQSKTVMMSSLPMLPASNPRTGEYPLHERTRSKIQQRRHRVHLRSSGNVLLSPCRFTSAPHRAALQIRSILRCLLRGDRLPE